MPEEPTFGASTARRGADEPNARDTGKDSQSKGDGSKDDAASPNVSAGVDQTPPAPAKVDGATLHETEIHPHKWLKCGARIFVLF